MAIRTDDERVSTDTPDYDRVKSYDPESLSEQESAQFDDIERNYDSSTADSDQEDANIKRAAAMESNPSASWQTDVKAKQGGINERNYTNKKSNKSFAKIAKKGGPFGLIIAILLGGAGLISFFGGPGLLLVHIAETIVEKVDFGVGSAEARSRRITEAKLTNSTTGACTKLVSFRCKYATFSEKEIARFQSDGAKNLGLEVTFSEDKSALGRYRMESMKIDGKDVPPSQFQSEMRKNPKLATAMISVHNWKFNSKGDARFNEFARKNAIKKTNVLDGAKTDKDRMERVITNTSIGAEGTITLGDEPDPCDEKCKEDRENRKKGQQLSDEARQKAENKVKTASPSGLRKFARGASITGAISDACIIPQTINAIGYGAKAVRSVQMIRYAMVFLTTASMIKAGDADPATVSFLGDILTTTFKNSEGDVSKAATDSFGYRNIAFGDTGLTESATLAMVGGGIGGTGGRGMAKAVYGMMGGKGTCDFLTNPVVEGVSILLNFVPGFGAAGKLSGAAIGQITKRVIAMGLKVGAEAMALNYLIGYLTDIGIDIAAGVVADENTYGEEAGDLLASGTREALTQNAAFGGNMILTPEQAVAYTGYNDKVMAMYGDYESATRSPLDPTSRHTFVGSIYSSMLPYASTITAPTVSKITSSLGSIVTAPLTLLNPQTKAVSADDFRQCEDYEYRDDEHDGAGEVATGPMCHLIRGVPGEYLELYPPAVAEDLFEGEHIDDTGAPQSSLYKDMVAKCWSGEVIESDDLPLCTARQAENESKSRFDTRMKISVHYIDERINEVNENGLPEPGYRVSPVTPPGSQTPGDFDDPEQACAAGTDDLGTIKTKYTGHLVDDPYPTIRLCKLPIPGWGAQPDHTAGIGVKEGAVVNAAVSGQFMTLINAANSASTKPTLVSSSSFRYVDSCEISTPGAKCASPGKSNHQLGIGIDFALTDGYGMPKSLPSCSGRIISKDPVWVWLNSNAPDIGIKQLAHENWHWDVEIEANNRCPR